MQPDIEIYVLSCPLDEIITWLKQGFTLLEKNQPSPLCTKITLELDKNIIPVTILEQASGKRFTSIWFDSSNTPWDSDISCAKDAYKHLHCEVRCNYQGWAEESDQDPDQWWKINDHGDGPFVWN